MSDWRANLVDDDAGLAAILREAKTVAVLGAKANPGEPAHVPAYLAAHGYRIRPVNPRFAGQRLHDTPTVAQLEALSEGTDVIEIFPSPRIFSGPRRRDSGPAVAAEGGVVPARHPRDAAAEKLARAGIRVVQDRCMMPEHRRLIGAGR